MRIVRRFVFAVAFLVATVLLIRAAKQHGDFLFMFYPGILREVETFLSELTAKLDYVLWERLALICLIWAVITLLLDIILQENLLRWVSGVAAFLALLLCLFVGMSGLNRYAPSVAESMRLENRTDYSADELRKAAIYYRNGANEAAEKVGRGPDGQFRAAGFEALGEELGSGMKNMIRTSYVFGGSTAAPKKLNHFKRYSDGPSVYCCLTGECCIDPAVEDSAMPFLMSFEAARRMSIFRDGDAAFVAILACIASDSKDYNYSGYFMAYRLCMQALSELDPAEADTVAEGESEALRADLASAKYLPEHAVSGAWIDRVEKLDKKERGREMPEVPDAAALLVIWHKHLTEPAEAPTEESVEEPLAA